MTAEQAGDQLTGYATNLLNQAADDFLANAQNRTEKLADYARDQTFTIEQRIFNDVQTIIAELHCAVLGVDTLLERQQKIFDENVNKWLQRILFGRIARIRYKQTAGANYGFRKTSLSRSWEFLLHLRALEVYPTGLRRSEETVHSNS